MRKLFLLATVAILCILSLGSPPANAGSVQPQKCIIQGATTLRTSTIAQNVNIQRAIKETTIKKATYLPTPTLMPPVGMQWVRYTPNKGHPFATSIVAVFDMVPGMVAVLINSKSIKGEN